MGTWIRNYFGNKRVLDRPVTKVAYDSIHNCPIGVYEKVSKNGDYSLLGKGGADNWHNIHVEFYEEFGTPKAYKDYVDKKLTSQEYYVDAILTGDKSLNTWGDIYNIEAEMAKKEMEGESASVLSTCMKLSKSMGFMIKPMETTVSEFYALIKEANG